MSNTSQVKLSHKKENYIYLDDFEEEALIQQLDNLFNVIGFSEKEARLEDIENAARLAIDFSCKQGGKVILIVGNSAEYLPKIQDSDKTKRGYFYSSDNNFSKLAADMHRSFTAVDLYLFGHKKNKNLGSIAEFIRLGGGDISYYDSPEPVERPIKSGQILQRPDFQFIQAEVLGDGISDPMFEWLEEIFIRQLFCEHIQ